MFQKFNIKTLLAIIIIAFISLMLILNSIIGEHKYEYLKSFISNENKLLIKKYIFPYKFISQQQQIISDQKIQIKNNQEKILNLLKFPIQRELFEKQILSEISVTNRKTNLKDNLILKKYVLNSGFYAGINNKTPGSGYVDFFEDNLVILSSRGVLAFRKSFHDDKNFKQIENNINDFIGINQFNKLSPRGKYYWFSLKDLLIFNNKIFISYTEEIKEDCWNTSVIYANMNYENIKFKKLFSPPECVHSTNNIEGEFHGHQSGGKLISINDNNIVLSVGDYRSRYLAQNRVSVNGKIIRINIDTKEYQIISMGHRNPQGLYYDKGNNFIIQTEHGPDGGDEINLIELKNIDKMKIQNYGWAISSAGEHYGGKISTNEEKYKKYPLYKSHRKHGFIEPLHSFVPSIGISAITKIDKNKFVVASLKNKSLYFFKLSEAKEISNIHRIKVNERIRDLDFNNNQIYLFMEDSPAIGVIDLN